MTVKVDLTTILSGEQPQYNRMAGGAIVEYVDVVADGFAVNTQCLYYGMRVIVAGTSAILYDNTTNSGNIIFSGSTTSAAAAADMMVPPSSVGVEMQNGVYVDLTGGGTLRIFYARA
jgi:hypothetical protein